MCVCALKVCFNLHASPRPMHNAVTTHVRPPPRPCPHPRRHPPPRPPQDVDVHAKATKMTFGSDDDE